MDPLILKARMASDLDLTFGHTNTCLFVPESGPWAPGWDKLLLKGIYVFFLILSFKVRVSPCSLELPM